MNDSLLHLLLQLKYAGVFLGACIEGPATALAAGVLVQIHVLSLFPTIVAHAAGDFSADMFYFSVGRMGNTHILRWLQTLFHFSDTDVEGVQKRFEKRHVSIIFIGKLTHFLGLPAIIGIGLSRYSWKKFALFNFIATILKSTLLVLVGYGTGTAWQEQELYSARIGSVVLILGLLFLCFLFLKKRYGWRA